MDFKDCVTFANENKMCYLATIENNRPRVRPMGLWYADSTGFYFQSHMEKALCIQLKANKMAEICFYNRTASPGLGTVLRVNGAVEFLDDIDYKKRIFEERAQIVKSYGLENVEDPRLAIFRISKGEAFFWTMEYNLRESDIEIISFP